MSKCLGHQTWMKFRIGGSLSSGHEHNTIDFAKFQKLPNLQMLKIRSFENSENFQL
jgi:hypothetical protein